MGRTNLISCGEETATVRTSTEDESAISPVLSTHCSVSSRGRLSQVSLPSELTPRESGPMGGVAESSPKRYCV